MKCDAKQYVLVYFMVSNKILTIQIWETKSSITGFEKKNIKFCEQICKWQR